MPFLPAPDSDRDLAFEAFGRHLRAARSRLAMTQMRLEELSGVDQTMISRLERGRAPAASLYKLLRLQAILGAELPLGYCPHDHDCPWRSTAGPPPPRMTALQRWRQMGLVV